MRSCIIVVESMQGFEHGGLNIRRDACALDFLSLGAVVHRLDPGIMPFRQARSLEVHVSGGEYNVAANLATCFGLDDRRRHGDGRQRHRRAGHGAHPRDRRAAVLQALQARRRARAEHRHRVQRPRPRRAGAGGVLQPGQRSRRPAQAGRLRLGEDLRRRRAVVPLGRHLRVAVGDDLAS